LDLVKDNTHAGDTILVSDWPGYIAFFLPDRHIFAADLLTSNRRWYSGMIEHGDPFKYIEASCASANSRLTHILWNGGGWLVASPDKSYLVYNDPRQYPVLKELGRTSLPPLTAQSGRAMLWKME
jgi:hypothetical protein